MFDPISLGLLLGGAAIQNYGQQQALKKQQAIMRESQQRQINARNQATDVAMRQVQEFDPTARQGRQDEIAQALTADYDQAVTGTPITAQGVQVGSTIPTSAGTSDYLTATAREKAKSTESLRQLAQLMGRLGSASQLRRDEAIGIGDAAGEIGRIQTNANNMAGIDEMRAAAVTPSLGTQLIGGAMSAYGGGRLATAGLGAVGSATGGMSLNPATMPTDPLGMSTRVASIGGGRYWN